MAISINFGDVGVVGLINNCDCALSVFGGDVGDDLIFILNADDEFSVDFGELGVV